MQPHPQRKSFSLRSLLPSSVVSLVVHAAILVFAGMSLRGCDSGAPSAAGGQDFREIGLAFLNDDSEAVSNLAAHNPLDTDVIQPSVPDPQPVPQPVIPTEAPSVSELMSQNPTTKETTRDNESKLDSSSTVGPGGPLSGLPEIGGGLSQLIQPQGNSGVGSAGSLTPGPGETSFMDIVGKGRSFVYVIDTSSSMIHDRRLELAKSQLKRSLRLLQPSQRFQVLFYNLQVTEINLRDRPFADLYPATKVNVQLAVRAIDLQTPSSGTKHIPAIQRALLLQPDVIYFLTDGETPSLSVPELKDVRRRNGGGAEIHVIEFATGSRESRKISWLQMMASESGGQYRRLMVK